MQISQSSKEQKNPKHGHHILTLLISLTFYMLSRFSRTPVRRQSLFQTPWVWTPKTYLLNTKPVKVFGRLGFVITPRWPPKKHPCRMRLSNRMQLIFFQWHWNGVASASCGDIICTNCQDTRLIALLLSNLFYIMRMQMHASFISKKKLIQPEYTGELKQTLWSFLACPWQPVCIWPSPRKKWNF